MVDASWIEVARLVVTMVGGRHLLSRFDESLLQLS